MKVHHLLDQCILGQFPGIQIILVRVTIQKVPVEVEVVVDLVAEVEKVNLDHQVDHLLEDHVVNQWLQIVREVVLQDQIVDQLGQEVALLNLKHPGVSQEVNL